MNIIATVLPIIVTALISWFLGMKQSKANVRKTTAEAVKLEIGNAEAVINFWKETAESLTSKLSELSVKCDELMDELELVRKENGLLRVKLDRYEKQKTAS